ncbi:MAG: hypothetical protein QOJ21_3770 [Solirubrobacteraceae bacterium]|nr:hypothetical protein [Solirubrobacteraceae bacterium]
MSVPGTTSEQDAVLAAYQFLDAFNERDADALAALITGDAELRTSDGRVWTGVDGARELLDAAQNLKLRLIPLHRHEHAEDRDRAVWVELWVRELVEDGDVAKIADIVVRDGAVASFALRDVPFEPGIA